MHSFLTCIHGYVSAYLFANMFGLHLNAHLMHFESQQFVYIPFSLVSNGEMHKRKLLYLLLSIVSSNVKP